MKRKALVLLLSFALTLGLAIPGTIAIASAEDEQLTTQQIIEIPPEQETMSETTSEPGQPVQTPSESEETTAETETPALVQNLVASDDTDIAENTPSVEDSTLMSASEETPLPTPAEKLITATEHIEGCDGEDCANDECPCLCHEPTLFERLMACETLEQFYAIVDELTEEELLAFDESLTEEEVAQLEAKVAELEPEPLPPVVIEESTDKPVESEIIYITQNVANVAPFGNPVVG